jgi:hypothetical protein
MPELCLCAAYVLMRLGRRPMPESVARPVADRLVVVCMAGAVTVAVVMAFITQPWGQLLGIESREAYLERSLPNQRLVALLNREGDAVRGVLMIGDRRAFYVDAPNWVDVSLGALEALGTAPDADAARAYLESLGVSHILVSLPDVEWHAQYDPDHRIMDWWSGFERARPGYLITEATYVDLALYRVAPAPRAGAARPALDLANIPAR